MVHKESILSLNLIPFDQYHSIGQVACEQETYCDQQFPRDQRSSSPSGITLSDPGHDGRSQSSTFTDVLQNQETFPNEDGVDANIRNVHIKKKECFQDMNKDAQLQRDQINSEMGSCQESTNNSQINIYRASSEKEVDVQRSSRCQSLPLLIPQSNAANCSIQRSGMGR